MPVRANGRAGDGRVAQRNEVDGSAPYKISYRSAADVFIGSGPPTAKFRDTLRITEQVTGARVLELWPSTLNQYYAHLSPAMAQMGFVAIVQFRSVKRGIP